MRDTHLIFLLKYRTYFSIALAGLLIIFIAFLRPQNNWASTSHLSAESYWIMKAQNKSRYDLLILGNSRAYRGVDPAEMEKILPGEKIYNFGFSSGGLDPELYEAAENLLDTASKHKAFLIAITPNSLISLNEHNDQYHEEHSRPRSAYFERVYIAPLLTRFMPIGYSALLSAVTGRKRLQAIYISDYHTNGWVGSHKEPEDTTEALPVYKKEMELFKVKPELIKALLDQTREWTAKGIKVFAFRPPTSQTMLNLEDSISGLDMKKFSTDFETAGGIWIKVDRTQYHSYDGSHVDENSAKKLSIFLAEKIKDKM